MAIAVQFRKADSESPTMERHRADTLVLDERVQRRLRPINVRRIAQKLWLPSIGVITVSRRAGGELVVIDGQHRLMALLSLGLGDTLLDVRVFDGLSFEGENRMFRQLNTSSKIVPIEDLIAGVKEKDQECVAIDAIVRRNGLVIRLGGGDGAISCADAMLKAFRSGEMGPAALGFAINVAVQAWGAQQSAVEAPIITGLARLYLRYGEEIDRPALIKKLAKYPGKASGIIANSRALREIKKGGLGTMAAEVILGAYNSRRTNPLPPL